MGGDPPVLVVAPLCFFQTPLICSKVLPTKVPSLFWNRCLTRNLTHPPHMFYKEVYDLKQKWPHKSWCFLPSGGPRHYDPGVYNQQREQLMAILPQSQQELPPRRWEISSNFDKGRSAQLQDWTFECKYFFRMIDSFDSAIIPLGSDAVLRDRYQQS